MDVKVIDKVFSRGTEDVKKNTTKYARKKFLELMNYIIKEKRDLLFIKKWLSGVKEEVLTSDKFTADDLMITTKISKPTDAYKSKPTHVRLAEKLIQEGKMLEAKEEKNSWSNRIFYIVTDHENKNEAILAEDFKGQWDRKYYWDVQIYAPIYRVLKVAWPDENWDEHNITFMEKLENKKDREEKKIKRLQELEDKKKEREEKKKVREEEKAKKELEKENKKQLKLI
jgi:DNA polymerase elongation subunit (family B)